MNGELPSAAICYGVYDDDKIIAFMGVLHQPNGKNKKIKRVCRLVVLPDYQGVGIATRFLKIIAEHYAKQGYDFSIVTSAKNLIKQLETHQKKYLESFGSRFVYASDEFYVKADYEIPDAGFYEEFLQIENGVGLLASLKDEFLSAKDKFKRR